MVYVTIISCKIMGAVFLSDTNLRVFALLSLFFFTNPSLKCVYINFDESFCEFGYGGVPLVTNYPR